MIVITLPDGTVKEVSEGTTSLDVATSISAVSYTHLTLPTTEAV